MAYQSLKVMLSQAPMIQPSDRLESFHVFVDASDIVIDNALMQKTPPNWYRPVYYASRRLSTAERNYSTMEWEALRMIYSDTKFRHYLLDWKFTFPLDHSALFYLVNKHDLIFQMARSSVSESAKLRKILRDKGGLPQHLWSVTRGCWPYCPKW